MPPLTLRRAARGDGGRLTEVTDFGPNPSRLRMHVYAPATVAAPAAIVVAVHNCTRSGTLFFTDTEFAALADRHGFIVVYPTATRDGSCFDVSSPQTLRHGGGSDSLSIISMVEHVRRHHAGDGGRVFVTGASSGAMMTNVLLGAYPDVFEAGASFMGVPFGCFATTDGSLWNCPCAEGEVSRTAREWGDLVRAAHPGHRGPRPRVQLWHGTEDDILRYPNLAEAVKQWTDVHGTGDRPARTDHPRPGWTRTRYGGAGDDAPVEAIGIQGLGHSLPEPGMAALAIRFFGLG
ncbi:MAG TPA: PHB depolymerase family esterase [Candidatus Dormibacteraeota bacterium]|nr:PHB depolymerase family esterase [Candidatus Dormibacteraeota bacterium]